ncbi:hypothetical protein CWM63_21435 [Klebsiella sp. F-Nf9]|nr:hypothetical protein CWM63_21435 [Klebsiella sp. F-Nf9]PKJ71611.1 hypothetical protein CW267_05315 [Klebsiella sp. X1-16S-Nf21]
MTDKYVVHASIRAFLFYKNANCRVLELGIGLKQRLLSYTESLWLSCMAKTFPFLKSTFSIFIIKLGLVKVQSLEVCRWFVRKGGAEFLGRLNTAILRSFWLWLIGIARYVVDSSVNRQPYSINGRLSLNDRGV